MLPSKSAVISPAAPTASPEDIDPDGKPGKLTIYLRGIESAEVFLDNERLPKDAPFERLPVQAGEHQLWVTDRASGLDFESTLLILNAKEQILILPPGGVKAPVAPADEPAPVTQPTPEPEPSKRPGRRSKKKRNR